MQTDRNIGNRAISYLRKRMDLLIALNDGYAEVTPEMQATSDAIQILNRLDGGIKS